jgi:hypothetical protein
MQTVLAVTPSPTAMNPEGWGKVPQSVLIGTMCVGLAFFIVIGVLGATAYAGGRAYDAIQKWRKSPPQLNGQVELQAVPKTKKHIFSDVMPV